MANYAICTMSKFKKKNLNGIKNHNKRENENYKNQNIDKSKSHLNISLIDYDDLTERVEKEIDDYYTVDRKYRSDAVMVNSFIIGASDEYFNTLSHEEQIKYFRDAKEFFEKRYGHVVMADCHFDEINPHMHLGLVPLVYDEERDVTTLSSKAIFNKTELRSLQSDFPKYMQSKGFEVSRGIKNNDVKYIKNIEDYKKQKMKETLEWLKNADQQSINDFKNLLKNADVKGVFKKKVPLEITPEERDKIVKELPYVNDMSMLQRTLQREEHLTKEKDAKIKHLQKKVDDLQTENENLKVAKDYLKNIFEINDIPEVQQQPLISAFLKVKKLGKSYVNVVYQSIKENEKKHNYTGSTIVPLSILKAQVFEAESKKLLEETSKLSHHTIEKVTKTFSTAMRKAFTAESKKHKSLEYDLQNKGYKMTENQLKRMQKQQSRGKGMSR